MAEPLKATFFTLRRRDRLVLLPATVVMIALVALIIGLFVALNWGFLSQLGVFFENGSARQLSEEASMRFMAGMFGLFATTILLLFPLYLVIAAYEAACLRWMIRGETPGLAGLVLDHDTWRVYGVYWCWLILQFVVSTVASIFMMPVMFMSMGEIIANPNADPEAFWTMQWKMHLISLIQYIPLAYLGIRFGPAAATSIARRRFSFLDAWTVTRDRFWALFGSYAVLWLLAGLAMAFIAFVAYGALLGDLIREIWANWPAFESEQGEAIFRRMFSEHGFAVLAAAYIANFAVFLAYALMSYGVNARAALAALEEGKVQIEPAS